MRMHVRELPPIIRHHASAVGARWTLVQRPVHAIMISVARPRVDLVFAERLNIFVHLRMRKSYRTVANVRHVGEKDCGLLSAGLVSSSADRCLPNLVRKNLLIEWEEEAKVLNPCPVVRSNACPLANCAGCPRVAPIHDEKTSFESTKL